jgi:hypothetical protein
LRHVCIAQHSFATFLLQQLIAASAHATMAAATSPRHLDANHYCATHQYHRIDQPTPPPSGLEHHRHCATVTAHKKEVFPLADRPPQSFVSI